ncbi:MAG: energy transducer TonB [Candidatus Acidiferrales bacterium]
MRDLGQLSECLVDNDAVGRVQAKGRRRVAIMLSTLCEASVVGALFLYPLLTSGVAPGRYVITPVPPYAPGATPPRAHRSLLPLRVPRETAEIFLQPLRFPPHAQILSSGPPPSVDEPTNGYGEPGAFGLPGGIPGADGAGPVVQPPRPVMPLPKRPVLISGGVMEARLIRRVEPAYPETARLLQLSGIVQMRAIIGADGRVRELTVLSGNPILATAAEAAVHEWRYHPTLLDSQPVEVETFITVTFVLGAE